MKHRKSVAKDYKAYLPYLLLAGIVIYAIVYSLAFVGGPSFYGDDTVYLGLAHDVLSGSFQQGPFIFSVRILQFLPIAFFYALFGVNLYTSSAWDILSFALSIIVAFFIGRELYDYKAGLFAALLLAFFPMAAELAPTVSDDIPLMFLTSLAMLFLILAQKNSSKRFYALSGVALVASPLVTPEGIIIIIVAFLYLIIEFARKKIKKSAAYVIIGMLTAGVMLMLFNMVTSQNPFVTITTNTHFYSAVGQPNTIPSTNTDLNFYPQTMFPYSLISIISSSLQSHQINPISIWQRIYVVNYNQSGFYFYALVLAALYLIIRKERRAYFALFWFVLGFLYLEFGPMHVSLAPFQYLLAYRLQRFLLLLGVPLVVVIGIAMSKAIGTNKNAKLYAAVVFVALALLFLISTSIPLNLFQYTMLAYERYDQLTIANYLSALPNTTKIYRMSGFSNIDSYMKFNNLSRLYAYDSISNCSKIPAGAYVIIPKYIEVFNLAYTPNPERYCPNWKLVLFPQYPVNVSSDISSAAQPFGAKLYLVPGNSMNSSSSSSTTNSAATTVFSSQQYNYFNLTGVGYLNRTTGKLTNFTVVNNVSSVETSLNRSSAAPGDRVRLNVTFIGAFRWYGNNATTYYLNSAIINVHYYGVELSNQTGELWDQNNGPWYYYVSQFGEPHQILFSNASRYLRVSWNITPTANATGKTLKLCGGYFATYENTTLHGSWAEEFDYLSRNQTFVVNSTVINIPTSACAYLSVT
jgi:hypothetical protein